MVTTINVATSCCLTKLCSVYKTVSLLCTSHSLGTVLRGPWVRIVVLSRVTFSLQMAGTLMNTFALQIPFLWNGNKNKLQCGIVKINASNVYKASWYYLLHMRYLIRMQADANGKCCVLVQLTWRTVIRGYNNSP